MTYHCNEGISIMTKADEEQRMRNNKCGRWVLKDVTEGK